MFVQTRRIPVSLLFLGTIALVGCGGEESAPATKPGGAIVIDGSSTVFRISRTAQVAYSRDHSDAEIIVNSSGTGGGFGKYLAGEIDIIDASRRAKPEEEAKAKAQGIEWSEFVVGHDGIAVVVNKNNDFVKSLTVAQLKALYEPNSKIKTWKDLNPAWPDRKIVVYSPDKDSGTHEFFAEAVVGGGAKTHRIDLQASADDNILVRGVGGDADGIGYFGYAYAVENLDKLRIVPIQVDEKAEAVAPSSETILKNTYKPLSRPLFIYVKNSSLRKPHVEEFVKYYLGRLEVIVRQAGYVPPTAEEQAKNQAALSGKPAAEPTVEKKS